jgi:hypothetical protein
MRVAVREINQPEYPAGMVPWLGTAHPELYDRLTGRLPDELQRLWNEHAPLADFEAALAELVFLHQSCCHLYRTAQAVAQEDSTTQTK